MLDKIIIAPRAEPGKRTASAQKTDRRQGSDRRKSQRPVLLAVGDLDEHHISGRALTWDSQITYVGFSEVNGDLISALNPDIILSCLVCKAFDFLELAQALCNTGFRGRFRIITPELPNPGIVLSEARALCPSLDIDFIIDQVLPDRALN